MGYHGLDSGPGNNLPSESLTKYERMVNDDQLPHDGESRARYDDALVKESAGLTKPGPFERFKRWFSAKF